MGDFSAKSRGKFMFRACIMLRARNVNEFTAFSKLYEFSVERRIADRHPCQALTGAELRLKLLSKYYDTQAQC
jgi:hypothetical protein